jgi:Rieske Fe-S protein
MGCLIHWQDADRKFHCPCHGGLFSAIGSVDRRSPISYVRPLPRLETKVEEGGVYVKIPVSQTSTDTTSGQGARRSKNKLSP